MTTLFDATLALAKVVGNVRGSTATGGSTTTIVDSSRAEANDFWNDGTIWIQSGNAANNSRKVLDWVLSSTLFSVSSFTSAVAAGNTYSAIVGDWPRDKLIEFINQALQDIGEIPAVSTSLTTVAYQEEYTLPAGVYNVVRVEMATVLSAPYEYQPLDGVWSERGGTLVFRTGREPQETGRILRLHYRSAHAALSADSDTVSNYVHIERLKWAAAVYAWRWRLLMSKEDEPVYANMYAEALARAEQMKLKHPIRFPVSHARNSL